MTTRQIEMLKRIAAGEAIVRDGKNHSILARLEHRLGFIVGTRGITGYVLTDAGRAAVESLTAKKED